eukprot:GEMP01090960.1.p1 GENE.GEMP01090960.1~~GEMP01090960.1.p1  ORF type:complete len:116 (+),score=11.47 GEMP01090960.1:84-431(+)
MAPLANRGFDFFQTQMFRIPQAEDLKDCNQLTRDRIAGLSRERRFWKSQLKDIGTLPEIPRHRVVPTSSPARTTPVWTSPAFADLRKKGMRRTSSDFARKLLIRDTTIVEFSTTR